jgi:hypothetical protein
MAAVEMGCSGQGGEGMEMWKCISGAHVCDIDTKIVPAYLETKSQYITTHSHPTQNQSLFL